MFVSFLYMFRATTCPSSGALFDCIYSFWYNAPVGSSVGALYQKLYMQSKIATEDGRICRPKHVGLN